MKDIGNKVDHKENQCPVDHWRKRKIRTPEDPANGNASKTQLTRMLGEITGIALILLPEFLGLHLVWGIFPVRVPGFPVGELGDGLGGGGGGGGGVGGSVGIIFLENSESSRRRQ